MSVIQALAAEMRSEAKNTRRLLERVPDGQFDWKPHPKSMSLGRLCEHIAELPNWTYLTLVQDELDFSKEMFKQARPATQAELLAYFDECLSKALDVLANCEEEVLSAPWTMRNGTHVYFTMPKKVVVRTWMMNHLIHHRGQLSVYLRLLDVPLPRMYGPTADEPVV